MALFKPFRGNRASLDAQPLHDGYAYFCTDDGTFHIDYVDADGALQRKQINAKEAEKIIGYDITTILNSSDLEIPTSKAVLDTINITDNKVDALIGPHSEGLEYTLRVDDSYEVKSIGTCTDTAIIIPSVHNGKRVTRIGAQAFSRCDFLTSIVIPEGVTYIGGWAFHGCESLTSVKIPSAITNIGDYTFAYCSDLTSITVPETVTSIGDSAFYNCDNLTSITIPDSVTNVKDWAFGHCSSLFSITIPDSVSTIGEGVFDRCDNLTIYCETKSQPEGWDLNWNPTNCPVAWGAVNDFVDVNEKFSNYATTEYVDNVVENINDSMVKLDTTLTEEGKAADAKAVGDAIAETFNEPRKELFWQSSTEGSAKRFKTTVDDSGTMTTARVYDYVEIPVASSFDNTGDGIPEVYLFSKVLPEPFDSTDAIQIDAVNDVTNNSGIHQEAGSHYMKYDEVAAGIGTLPPHVYCYDNSTNYLRYSFNVDEDGIYELAAHLRIKDEQLRGATYTINKGTNFEHAFVTTYGWNSEEEAFAVRNSDELQGSYMRGMLVHLHAGVNTIHITPAVGVTKNQHFRNLYLVKTADLPTDEPKKLTMDEAENIGVGLAEGAILPEYSDITVTFNNGAPRSSDGFCRVITSNGHKMSIQKITLADKQKMPVVDSTVTLRGKIGCVNSTVNGSIGQEARIFDATIIESLAFRLKSDNTYEVSGIGTCTNTDIIIPSKVNGISVTSIGNRAFFYCESLTSITIPYSITSISDEAFTGCTSLTSISIPDSVTSIGYAAFMECISLISIVIPDSVTSIGDFAFDSCVSLANTIIGNGIANISKGAFYNCRALASIDITDSITSIGVNAFNYCESLMYVTIPNSVTSIGSTAFTNCRNLTIYCEAKSQPEDWNTDWNPDNRPVIWGAVFDIHNFYSSMVSSAPQIMIGGSLAPTSLIMYSGFVGNRCCGAEICWREEGSSLWNVAYVPISAFSKETLPYSYDLANLVSDSFYRFDVTKPCEIYTKKAEYGKLMSPASNIVVYQPQGGTVKISYNGTIYSAFTSKTTWSEITDLQLTASNSSDSATITISGNQVSFKGLPVVTSAYSSVRPSDTIDFDATYIALDD